MTANQLQYWRNVETERANKAQEQTIPSQIALNEANKELSLSKSQVEQLNSLLKQFELERAPLEKQKLAREIVKIGSESAKLDSEANLKQQEYLKNMYETELQQSKYANIDTESIAAAEAIGDYLRGLFGGLVSTKVGVSAKV